MVLKEFEQTDFEKCSYRDSFKSFFENLRYMIRITAATRKKIESKVTNLIFNAKFVDEFQKNVNMQNQVCKVVNIYQSADTSSADAVNLRLALEVHAESFCR